MAIEPIVCRGWKSICGFLGIKDKRTAKKELLKLDLLNYEFGKPILYRETYLKLKEEQIIQFPAEYVGPERKIEEKIIAGLPKHTRRKQQVKTTYGIIDILIPGKPPTIIEVKNKPTSGNIQSAIGQLLLYRHDYPDAILYIACADKMPKKYLSAIEPLGIKEWATK